jgi:hypothetical protein
MTRQSSETWFSMGFWKLKKLRNCIVLWVCNIVKWSSYFSNCKMSWLEMIVYKGSYFYTLGWVQLASFCCVLHCQKLWMLLLWYFFRSIVKSVEWTNWRNVTTTHSALAYILHFTLDWINCWLKFNFVLLCVGLKKENLLFHQSSTEIGHLHLYTNSIWRTMVESNSFSCTSWLSK